MEITNQRISHTNKSTLGLISFDNENPFAFSIEDEPRVFKIKGETRIPAGRYRLGIRKEDTPLTLKHRASNWYSSWFDYHIEVLNVPNFTGVYFHIVTSEQYTEGCQGFTTEVKIIDGEYRSDVPPAADCMKLFYDKVYPLLENGEEVWYNIKDADK